MKLIKSNHETEVITPIPGSMIRWKPGDIKEVDNDEVADKILAQKGFTEVKQEAEVPKKPAKKGGK